MNRNTLLRLLVCLLLGICAGRLWSHRSLGGQPVSCRPISPITWEESWTFPYDGVLPALRTGDVLVTLSSHTLGWRHGHCALVLDPETTLEATTLGCPAVQKTTESWNRYPTLWLLRPKIPLSESERSVLLSAAEELSALPYALFCPKRLPADGAHCAALVWYVYARAGIDIDAAGDWLFLPSDLLSSPYFNVIPLQRKS